MTDPPDPPPSAAKATEPAESPPPPAGPPPPPVPGAPPAGAYGAGPLPGPPPYGGYGHPGFAPVPRATRVPWVNPVRRLQVVIVSIVAGLLLLGAGMAIGAAAGGGHRGGYERLRPMMGNEFGPNFGPPGTWRRGHLHPPAAPLPTPTAPPTR